MTRWRFRCPHGHAALRVRSRKPGYYCKSCSRGYADDPIDLKTETLPDDPPPRDPEVVGER